jgi:CubicO group peptidase (beta-lactamase class C family)
MGTNHVGSLYGGFGGGQSGVGFGLTVFVVQDAAAAGIRRSNGSFGWGGAFGTMSWTDPKEKIAAVLMIQQPNRAVQADFQNAVMQAIVE